MEHTHSAEPATKPWATQRKDNWWVEPALVAIGFTLFIVYSTYRALLNQHFEIGTVISPFYSPNLGPFLSWWQWSPAILILWIPAGFRATCYYYRKAYYRAYFMDPPGCGVGHFGGNKYCGENVFPLVLQNLHRYMLYLAILILGFLWYDAFIALTPAQIGGDFRFGLVNLIMFANVILLSGYTFGCHAFRHLVGGRLDCFSCSSGAKTQHKFWELVTKFNEKHMLWAWLSLFSVGFTDFYISQLAAQAFVDPTFFGSALPLNHIL